MTQDEFLKRFREIQNESFAITSKKNSDYAGTEDSFKNFSNVLNYGISVEQGILVRMSDKMTRISNLLTRNPKVTEENITDTLTDLANYAIILRVWIEQKKRP